MDWDLIVIGGGPGGYAAAIKAAQLGAKVAIVEEKKLGGTCLNRGCIPTKALYKNAQILNTLRHIQDFGINLDGYSFDMDKIQARKQEIVDRLVNGIGQLVKANGIEVFTGSGSFIDRNTVAVKNADGVNSINAKNILIATGSVPAKPPVPGLDLPGVMTSDEFLDVRNIPGRVVVIGGGIIGIEFAGILSSFGADVTVMEFMPSILPMLDGDISKRLTLSLKKKGIRFETGVSVKEIVKQGDNLTVTAEGPKGQLIVECDSVLVSTGRIANVEGLNLDGIGVEYDRKGIKVDESYATNVPGVYAIGDVIGGQMLAHVASAEGIAAAENIMGLEGSVNYSAVPNCVFTFPEVATVGLTEDGAKEQGIKYISSKFMFGANGKALTMGEEEGFVKVLATEETREIIGVHIMGPNASDLVHEAALAVENKLTVADIEKTIHAHPTLSEALFEAVLGIEGKAVHMQPARKR